MDKTTLNKFLKQLSHLNFGHSAWLLINGFKSAEKNVNVEELPFYNEERYKKLQENPVSIISETCMGGGYCTIKWDFDLTRRLLMSGLAWKEMIILNCSII